LHREARVSDCFQWFYSTHREPSMDDFEGSGRLGRGEARQVIRCQCNLAGAGYVLNRFSEYSV
jgi:hypothetical protein